MRATGFEFIPDRELERLIASERYWTKRKDLFNKGSRHRLLLLLLEKDRRRRR